VRDVVVFVGRPEQGRQNVDVKERRLHGSSSRSSSTRGSDPWRAAIEAQHSKTASFLRHKRPFGGLSDQVAHGLAERQPMALCVSLRHLHGIVFELKRRSGHVSIISRL
jgi:hypothetical protein